MRKIYALLVVMGCAVTLKAQLVFSENFTGLANGNLNNKNSWVSAGTGTDVQVASATPLIFPTYTSGSQYITISGSSTVSAFKSFSQTIANNSNRFVYTSFVIRLSSSVTDASSCVRIVDGTATNGTANILYSFYAKGDGSGNVEFGLNMGGGTGAYTSNNYAFNTTYLIVIRYDIVSGNNNDNVRLWVNPATGGGEPATNTAVVSILNSNDEVTYGSLTRLQIRQQDASTFSTPVAALDAFKVSTATTSAAAWSNLAPAGAPLPVKLDNFDASKEAAGIKVYWNTSDEIGVKNYQIERSEDGLNFSAIGTVAAEKKKTYSFVDAQPAATNNFYRLRMVDFDGNYKLSHVVSIKSKASLNIILSPNPVKDRMLVQHPKAENNNRIQVINVDGKVLIETRVPANAVQTNIDLSMVRAGLYHVVFQSEAGVFSKTIFKQ